MDRLVGRRGLVKVLKFKNKEIVLTGMLMSIEKMEIDIVMLYKLLNIIYEKPGISLTELFKEYRRRVGVNVNYNKIKKHVEYAEIKELVTIKKGKPARLEITKKGIDWLFIQGRSFSVLGETV
ncbi:MAG: hypothetical protein J7K21_05465 [Desulfurococcales archaeon]|nr:hypothetical protein [Desulfurococcales archaeon]